MQKSSLIMVLSVLLFFSAFIVAAVFQPAGLALFLISPAIFCIGLYSKGPKFREINKKSFLSIIIGVSLFYVWIIVNFALGSAVSIPYVPSVLALILFAGFCLVVYGIVSHIRGPYFKMRHNANPAIRSKAFDEINDEQVFSYVAMENGRPDIRQDAVKRITNQHLLEELLFNAEHDDVREEAAKRITDEDVLRRYISQGRSDSAEFFAKSVLNKDKVLNERNFNYLNHLISNGEKEITFDSDINLETLEAQPFKNGIEIGRDGLTIDGNGFSIDAGGISPFFKISGENITFKNLKFKNGASDNISNKGDVTFINCLFENSSDCVLLNEKSAKLVDCIFSDNNARVIKNKGKIQIDNCTFRDNAGPGEFKHEHDHIIFNHGEMGCEDCIFKNSNGGAISNRGRLSVSDCTFDGNTHENDGGAISHERPPKNMYSCEIYDSTFIKNTSKLGGAISSRSLISIRDCYFRQNHAEIAGAALFNNRYSVCTFKNSKFEANTSESGVIYNFGGLSKTAYDGMMGYSARDASKLKYKNLEFVNNDASDILSEKDAKVEKL